MSQEPTNPYTPPKESAAQPEEQKFYWFYDSLPEVKALSKPDRKLAARFTRKKLWRYWQTYIGFIINQLPITLYLVLDGINRDAMNKAEWHSEPAPEPIPVIPFFILSFLITFLYQRYITFPLQRKYLRQWAKENLPKSDRTFKQLFPTPPTKTSQPDT